MTNKEFIEKHQSDIADLQQEINDYNDQIAELKKENQ
jgi:hypothetical protein